MKQLLRRLNLKYNIATKKLIHRLEFPDEHISETPGRVNTYETHTCENVTKKMSTEIGSEIGGSGGE